MSAPESWRRQKLKCHLAVRTGVEPTARPRGPGDAHSNDAASARILVSDLDEMLLNVSRA